MGFSDPVRATAFLALSLAACESRTAIPAGVESVEIDPESFTLVEGRSQSARAIPRGPGGVELTGRATTWTTDDPEIATVDGSGTLEAVGPGETTLRATVDGVTGQAPVTVEPGALIELFPTTVALTAVSGDGSGTEVVSVTNGGGSTLSGLAVRVGYPSEGPSGWLTAGLGGTTAPVDLSLSASAATLDPGSYEATAVVESSVAGGLSAGVDVDLTVEEPPPSIVLNAEEVFFGTIVGGKEPAVQVVAVTNGGGGILDGLSTSVRYADGEPGGWMEALLAAPLAPTELTLRATPGVLPPGSYHASVEVRSDRASVQPRTLAVEFQVHAGEVARGPDLPATEAGPP